MTSQPNTIDDILLSLYYRGKDKMGLNDYELSEAKAALLEAIKAVIGEYSQYPSHYTISDVLHDQNTKLINLFGGKQ